MGTRFNQRPLKVTFNNNLNYRLLTGGSEMTFERNIEKVTILNFHFQFKRDSSSFHRVFLRATLEAFWLYLVRKIGNYSVPSLEGH